MSQPTIISVHSGKGGIGKTTTATSLAWTLGDPARPERTVLIDANARQRSATVIYERLQVDAPYAVATEPDPRKLAYARDLDADLVIIDTPPSDLEAAAANEVADLILVPYVARWLEDEAVALTLESLQGRPHVVLFTMVRHNKERVNSDARGAFLDADVRVLDSHVRYYDAHEKAQAAGYPVFLPEAQEAIEHADRCAADYLSVREELLTLPELKRTR